jgi:D-cysteine desulfhydrase
VSLAELKEFVDARPRLRLGVLPTPLVKLERLSADLGIELWLKRDDMSGIALGGNKTRKMEFILAEAMAQGYQEVMTVGPVTSNHTMMTAMAALRAGLRCHCVVLGPEPEFYDGNILLLRTMQANLVFVAVDVKNPTAEDVRLRDETMTRVQAETGAFLIPGGGTMPCGEPGYMNAVLEIAGQCGGDLPFDAIFVAYGTGGTTTGIVLGQAVAGFRVPVYAVAVGSEQAFRTLRLADCASLAEEMAGALELERYERPPVREVFGYAETGYSVPTVEGDAAMKRLACREGYLLDPVYTAKAFAGLLDLVAKGEIGAGSRVLFVHTGGLSMTPVGRYAWPATANY